MSYVERLIDVEFILYNGTFKDNKETVYLSGLRCEVILQSVDSLQANTCSLKVYGMKEDDMNKVSTFGMRPATTLSHVNIYAGDNQTGVIQIFSGDVAYSTVDYNGAPEVMLCVEAYAGYQAQITPIAPNSYEGSADVATMIESLAKAIGFGFRNNGVNVKLSNHYLCGTAIDQIYDCANAANIACVIENDSVNIWMAGIARDNEIIEVSPSTGLIGYPSFQTSGLSLTTVFNPNIKVGRMIRVTSEIERANGNWKTYNINHLLSSKTPSGPWFTQTYANWTTLNVDR